MGKRGTDKSQADKSQAETKKVRAGGSAPPPTPGTLFQPPSPAVSPENKNKLRELAKKIEKPLAAMFDAAAKGNTGVSADDTVAKEAEPHGKEAEPQARDDDPQARAVEPQARETEPKAREAEPQTPGSSEQKPAETPRAKAKPKGHTHEAQPKVVTALALPEAVDRECQYCNRTVGSAMYSTVLPSGKVRCKECATSLYRDTYVRGELGEVDVDFLKSLSMSDRMRWHRDHAAVALRDLPHNMVDWIRERKTNEVVTAHYAGGPMIDEDDLDEKYKNKPDQLANIKQHAYSCIHPTRRVKMWEDVELRRHWNQTETQKTDVGREATGSVTVKQAKPLKDKTEKAAKQAKTLADKKAKPLGPTLKKQIAKHIPNLDLAISESINHIGEAIKKGVHVSIINKMQNYTDEAFAAREKLSSQDSNKGARESILRSKAALDELETRTTRFVAATELTDGDEAAVAVAKRIPLCAAKKANNPKQVVCEG